MSPLTIFFSRINVHLQTSSLSFTLKGYMLKSDEKEAIHKEKRNGSHRREWLQIWTLRSEIEKRLRVRLKDVTCVLSVYTVHSKQYTHQVSNRLLI